MKSSHGPPRADLRCKYSLPSRSDVESFLAYPCNLDQWEDGRLGEVFDYLWCYKNLQIPVEWVSAMNAFHFEYMNIRAKVP